MLNESLLMSLLEIRDIASSLDETLRKIMTHRQDHKDLTESEFIYHTELSHVVHERLQEIRFISNGDYEKLNAQLTVDGINLPRPVLDRLKAWNQSKLEEFVRNR